MSCLQRNATWFALACAAVVLAGCGNDSSITTVPSELNARPNEPVLPSPTTSPPNGPPRAVPATPPKGAVDLVLEETGEKPREVIKVIFGQTTLDMPQVRAIMDHPPAVILQGVSRGQAEFLQQQLEAAGAKTSIK